MAVYHEISPIVSLHDVESTFAQCTFAILGVGPFGRTLKSFLFVYIFYSCFVAIKYTGCKTSHTTTVVYCLPGKAQAFK